MSSSHSERGRSASRSDADSDDGDDGRTFQTANSVTASIATNAVLGQGADDDSEEGARATVAPEAAEAKDSPSHEEAPMEGAEGDDGEARGGCGDAAEVGGSIRRSRSSSEGGGSVDFLNMTNYTAAASSAAASGALEGDPSAAASPVFGAAVATVSASPDPIARLSDAAVAAAALRGAIASPFSPKGAAAGASGRGVEGVGATSSASQLFDVAAVAVPTSITDIMAFVETGALGSGGGAAMLAGGSTLVIDHDHRTTTNTHRNPKRSRSGETFSADDDGAKGAETVAALSATVATPTDDTKAPAMAAKALPTRPSAAELLRFTAHYAGRPLTADTFNWSFSGLDYCIALATIAPQALDLSSLCWSVAPIAAQTEANVAMFLECARRHDAASLQMRREVKSSSPLLFSDVPLCPPLLTSPEGGPMRPEHLRESVAAAASHLRCQMWLHDAYVAATAEEKEGVAMSLAVQPSTLQMSAEALRERRAQLREHFCRPAATATQGQQQHAVASHGLHYYGQPSPHGAQPSSAVHCPTARLLVASALAESAQPLVGTALPLHPLLRAAGLTAVSDEASRREAADAEAAAVAAARAAKASAEAAALQTAANSSAASKFRGVPSCATRVPPRLAGGGDVAGGPTPMGGVARRGSALPPNRGKTTSSSSSAPSAPSSSLPVPPPPPPISYFDHASFGDQLGAVAASALRVELLEAQLRGAAALFEEAPEAPDFALLLASLTRTVALPSAAP